MLLWMSSGVEVFAVGVCEGDVETGAAFEFADAGGNGSEVLGGLGDLTWATIPGFDVDHGIG